MKSKSPFRKFSTFGRFLYSTILRRKIQKGTLRSKFCAKELSESLKLSERGAQVSVLHSYLALFLKG